MTDLWLAPTVTTPLDAVVCVPGSKSLSNRYLVLAALAATPSRLRGVLDSRDTRLMAAALQALGVQVDTSSEDWVVTPGPLHGDVQLDVGLAGTVMRFIPPLATLATGTVRLDGDVEAYARPMGPMLEALRQLGVQITEHGEPGRLPFTIHGLNGSPSRATAAAVDVDASTSSQFVSGLLLSGARLPHGLVVRHVGPTLPSLPHIQMTVDTLRSAGVQVDDSRPHIWAVAPGPISGREISVEPDLSNAAPFLAAALICGGQVQVPHWPQQTTQPGALLPEILTAMGGKVVQDENTLTVQGTGQIHGIDLDLRAAGELAPTIAAVAALADSPTRLRGIGHLRGHETDRLAALATELTRLGGQVEQTADGLVITARPLHGGQWRTYADHRMATAGALIGLRVPEVFVENISTTAKTLPGFVHMWDQMLGTPS